MVLTKSDENSSWGDVVFVNFNKASSYKDNIFNQIYKIANMFGFELIYDNFD